MTRKLINPIGRISERVLRASWKAMTRTYLGTAEPFRGTGEKNENTGRTLEQREKVGRKEMHGAGGGRMGLAKVRATPRGL